MGIPVTERGRFGVPFYFLIAVKNGHYICKEVLDKRKVVLYIAFMIKSIRHKGLKLYWTKNSTKLLQELWMKRIKLIMVALDAAEKPSDMDIPGLYFHALTGGHKGYYSVRVTGNWRITFSFEGEDAININLEDYH